MPVGLDANASRGCPIGEIPNWAKRVFGPKRERWIESLPDRLSHFAAETRRGSSSSEFGREFLDLMAAHTRAGAVKSPPMIEVA